VLCGYNIIYLNEITISNNIIPTHNCIHIYRGMEMSAHNKNECIINIKTYNHIINFKEEEEKVENNNRTFCLILLQIKCIQKKSFIL
jgi:hypothetical protein